ncbi:hypothetical protein EQG63_12040 [Flavobacterium amnicola]|uniref:Uncharacterized protein n=1 Tax=Flavobacterium amnicola TaxID=2506422 RepID=A0A4Q1K0D7_9FLAO|nr:hypothetical protein [Flavobacterium amnicola]RXR15963.1 hypothetical protein EQG63_12040 [Flavobacterium amnicola]
MEEITNIFKLHFYRNDELHVIDAITRNECERELLSVIKIVCSDLEIDVNILSEIPEEGGFTEIWQFLGKHSGQLSLLIAIIALIYSRIPVENSKLTELQIENLELDNEIKKEELKQLRQKADAKTVEKDTLIKLVEHFEDDFKINWHKSNFYRKLISEKDITSVSFTGLDSNNNTTIPEKIVEREQFSSFVINTSEFPPLIDEEATIDIISPVLKSGNFHWKGYYNKQIISFQMKDLDFKGSVLNLEVDFNTATSIKCVLQQNRRIDDTGKVYITLNKVITVLEVNTSNNTYETNQGKKYKKQRKENPIQLKMDI